MNIIQANASLAGIQGLGMYSLLAHESQTQHHYLRRSFGGKETQIDDTIKLIPKTLAKLLGERVISPLLDKGMEIAKCVDDALSRVFNFILVAKANDTGLIGWFDTDYPKGWEEYTNLRGRVPIGVGYYIGITEDSCTEAPPTTATGPAPTPPVQAAIAATPTTTPMAIMSSLFFSTQCIK